MKTVLETLTRELAATKAARDADCKEMDTLLENYLAKKDVENMKEYSQRYNGLFSRTIKLGSIASDLEQAIYSVNRVLAKE